MVSEFDDVFPTNQHGPPPNCDIYFGIDVKSGTKQFSILPYRMTTTELGELKEYLKDLLVKGLIRLSVFYLGGLVLFMKKNDGTLHKRIDYKQLKKVINH